MFRRLLLIGLVCLITGAVSALAETAPVTSEARLQQAVADNGVVLSDAQRASMATTCQSAQAVLYRIQQSTGSLIEERSTFYIGVQQELQAIKLRMVRQGADASETDLLTGKIQQGLDDFGLKADDYRLSLADVVSVNCQQQPEYFKAGLVVMRLKRALLLDSAVQLKAVVQNSDDSIFSQLKQRLVI
jgi:hypothetical protein